MKTNSAVAIKKVRDLSPDGRNANKGSAAGNALIEKSLRKYGAGRSILIDKNGAIIAGNKTAENCAAAGLEDVVVVKSDGTKLIAVQRTDLDINDPKARELAIADNRASEVSLNWDLDVLADLKLSGVDLGEFWSEKELDSMWPPALLVDEDDVPALPKVPKTKAGDLYLLGKHRLLCGNSTVMADVERLMGGEKADMVFTDPPYGVDYDGGTKKREKLKGDNSTSLYKPACAMAQKFTTEVAPLYLWHAGVKGIAAAAAAAAAGYEIRCELIWNKNQAQFGALSAQYKQKHETCYYCFKRGKVVNWVGPKNETTVWDVARSSINEFHPTQKPVALAERALTNHTAMRILDLFGGSGSTLIACEKTARRCFMMELDPAYCDVIVKRWEAATGKQAKLERTNG